MKRTSPWLRAAAPLLLALLLLSPLAWGRAGGGGSYSGGSHSSGSHSSSSHSSGSHSDSAPASSSNSYAYNNGSRNQPGDDGPPLTRRQWGMIVAVLILLLLAWFFYRVYFPQREQGSYGAAATAAAPAYTPPPVQEESRMRQALAALKARDPGFDERGFLERISGAFRQVQQAWSGQDMRPARSFISDGVMERFSIQLEMMKADGLRNELGAVNVLEASIIEAESDAHFDTLHVKLRANAVDSEISLADGKRLAGTGRQQEFTEIWFFLRRPGAATLGRPGLMEGCCPSCGAALPIADAAQCGSCKSWVNSGEYDWVLSEITQECEWAVRGSGDDVPGFAALAQGDALLNTQFLEDRASVAFWRWQQAMAEGNAKALCCVATEGYCGEWDRDPVARRYRFRETGVGTVQVMAFETGGALQLAHVGVKWSGDQYEAGAPREAPHRNSLRQHVFVLGRREGVATEARSGLCSSRCPNCGAPPASRELAACEYCGTPFNDGSRQWVVTQILPISLWRRPQPAQAAASQPKFDLGWTQGLSSTEALAVMVAGMMSDGRIDDGERECLERYAQDKQMIPGAVEATLEAAREGHLEIPRPATPQEAEACLDGLIGLSLADGKVEVNELKLILAYAARAGIAQEEVTRRLKVRRARQQPQVQQPLSIVSQ